MGMANHVADVIDLIDIGKVLCRELTSEGLHKFFLDVPELALPIANP